MCTKFNLQLHEYKLSSSCAPGRLQGSLTTNDQYLLGRYV
ncbi:hypothetical protein RNAN_0983 [Rheinheimera nanhaiensis E407-8]|uniref:Uncharacterized protein n=1 Tax=Rheinheimera nanhaiensis E407-8 TaxID=562729 RepID=I1DVD4_9GAMM|nr:hypothetical protein RNAN_0983 [Rheinheimera nanhaiensis E407-8]